ncbi:MAG TPA: NAD-dependent epimerase/dehydratase family protein [Clostridia bacterium]|nr:NAD-dependent epimerase/dehydratase family protein [Clostridia bacterium]
MKPIVIEDMQKIAAAKLPWEAFKGKTVLIAGANGFLPGYMLDTLLYLNDNALKEHPSRVIALVRNRDKAMQRFAVHKERQDFRLMVQDVCDPVAVEGNIDYIIHAASQASPKYYGKDPVGTLNSNLLGTNNLLRLANSKKVKGFLFFSSGEVYGEVKEEQIPTKEENYGYIDPMNVRSCYSEGKRAAETMCVSWFRQYGIPVKVVRPFHTYGPGMALDDGRVFADFVSDIVNGRNIVLNSDGTATRAFCYLADATTGFFTVLLKGQNGHAYNVGNDRCEISILDLAKLLLDMFPGRKLEVIQNGGYSAVGYIKSNITRACPDISKVRKLGWEPSTSIAEGFKRTVMSFL